MVYIESYTDSPPSSILFNIKICSENNCLFLLYLPLLDQRLPLCDHLSLNFKCLYFLAGTHIFVLYFCMLFTDRAPLKDSVHFEVYLLPTPLLHFFEDLWHSNTCENCGNLYKNYLGNEILVKDMNYFIFGENFIHIAISDGELQCFKILNCVFLWINNMPIWVIL